ncbi:MULTISPECIES: alpha-1,2-fucosyltransferase [Bacteroides]|jgi:hypothetical protein|uniref:alpha-1,2-fucosyltransferase n=1 Tax=Bacteroides TaxID=816 RepID=UPI00117FF350|nr:MULTISPECIES: alpha-1,2-fucosyltransferase [Bacteroides]
MIHVYIRGGRLGNQLFQYAYIRHLQKHNPEQKVCYHFDEVYQAGSSEDDFVNALKFFKVKDVEESGTNPKLSLIQKILLRIYWRFFPHRDNEYERNIFQKRWVRLMDVFNLKYLDVGYHKFRDKVEGDVIVSGCFESEKYFADIKNEILEEIKPLRGISEKNQLMLERMRNTNSVLLSVRRGDFVYDTKFSSMHAVCTPKYYERAWEYMKAHVENPVLFIFSNDIEWVKQNLDFGVETHYESGNDPSWEALELMSNCKHFIISNSTFNWWAQYKSTNNEKIVCAPARWWNGPLKPDLFLDNWALISVD